jgi:hypothetical protein
MVTIPQPWLLNRTPKKGITGMSLFDNLAARLRHRRYVGGAPVDVFDNIYRDKAWRVQGSVSGRDLDFDQTQALYGQVPEVVRELNVSKLLDVPCGDFNWMRQIVEANLRSLDRSVAVIGSVLTTTAKIA